MKIDDNEAVWDRRGFLEWATRWAPSMLLASCASPRRQPDPEPEPEPAPKPRHRRSSSIESITHEVLWSGRSGGTTWFHPRPCVWPGGVLMTLQSISGSDFYGQVHWTHSTDQGRTWAPPQPIEALGWREVGGGYSEGVCDVVPDYHAHTKTVLALGHNVYYRGGKLARPQRRRFPVYSTGDGHGTWSARRVLAWQHPEADRIYTCGCAERLIRADGAVLIPISFGSQARNDRAVTSLLCSFDGEQLRVREVGNTLRLPVRRGLLEPSLAWFAKRYRMTIRAEDGHGYHATSDDGLRWSPIRRWQFDDGEALAMSTTQQHWLVHKGRLHLVYTRQDDTNAKVMRFRAPIYTAVVDAQSMDLIRASERVVLPLRGDPIQAPREVARMGNFHSLRLNADESWVTVGEARPNAQWQGDVLLARIR